MGIIWLYVTWIAYFKLSQWGVFRGNMSDFVYSFIGFMVVKNFFFSLLYRVFAFMRTRDWLKQRKWDNKKREMEQHIYTQKYQEFLKYQELSNSNEIKEIDYDAK